MRVLLLAAVALPLSVGAQATVTVPVQDPVYRDLDRLFGSGLIKTMIVGQRPYSRREIARMIVDASTVPSGRTVSGGNQRIIARLAREYASEVAWLRGDTARAGPASVDRARVGVLGTNSRPRAIPADPTGSVEADVDPLLNGRAGRTYRAGTNVEAEVDASLRVGRGMVLRLWPRVVGSIDAGSSFAQGSLEAASATMLARNVMAEIGRQQFVWGQGMEGGLLGSSSGRPLDMIRIANDTPFFLYKLGPARGSLVFVDLGPNQRFPHSNIVAYKLSGNPFTSRFELSASVLSEQGGRGAPSATFVDNLVDIIPALKYTIHSKNRGQFSNKFAGWEYRLRLPELSGLQLYAEHQFDDMDPRRWRSTLWEDGGHIAGLSFSQLGAESNVSAAAEFHHTGLRYYTHTPFISGIAFNRTLLGDPLGNQGDGGYLRLAWDAGGSSSVAIDGAIERRGGDVWTSEVDGVPPNETNFHFVLLEGKPKEWRRRLTGTWTYRAETRWRASVEAGYERATNYGFVKDAIRNNFLVAAGIELLPW